MNRLGDGRGPASERTVVRRLAPVSDPKLAMAGRPPGGVDRETKPATPAPPLQDIGASTPGTLPGQQVSKPVVAPASTNDNRVQIRFCVSEEVHHQLRELQALMRHQVPDGDLAKILSHAVGVLHKQVRKTKFAECEKPRVTTKASANQTEPRRARRIPAAIRRAVTKRDIGTCSFRSDSGRQCGSTEFLEFHHEIPWAREQQHEVDNISLRCRAHNRLAAERDFSRSHMARFAKAPTARRVPTRGENSDRGKAAWENSLQGQLALPTEVAVDH